MNHDKMPLVEPTAKRTIAGKYEVRGVLGQGGTGIVYDAIDTATGEPLALKVMHDALAGDRQIRGRFRREAVILRRLAGDHVCPILDSGEVSGEEPGTSLLYIALPKIRGESLAELLAKGLLDVPRALDVLLQVLAALAAAHGQGVIHRDLKPANVLLQDGTKVIVVDFGMSKIITGSGLGTTNLTTHNMVFGTPEYMSPEQARGDDLDGRCDVYAAGVILYEMLTGAPPFTGTTPLVVLTAHLTSDLEPPSQRSSAAGRVSPALEAVVLHALARDRAARYPSAAAFAAAIVRARSAPGDVDAVHPARLSLAPKPDAFASTVPDDVATAPTLVSDRAPILDAAIVTRASAPTSPPRTSRPPPSPAAPSIDSLRTWILLWIVVGTLSIATGVYFALRH